MSEILEAQKEIKKLEEYKDVDGNLIFALSEFCGQSGKLVEKIAEFIKDKEIPNDLKLDLWEFAVVARRLKVHANKIQKGTTVISSDAIVGDFGDIGNQSKRTLARVNEGVSMLSDTLKVSLREVFEISKVRMKKQAQKEK